MFDARRRGELRLRYNLQTLRDLTTAVPGTEGYAHPWKYVRNSEPVANLRSAWRTFGTFKTLFPEMNGVGIERVWAGHIDYTPDAVPVIERLTSPEGLIIATGFSGHGFALGPGGGALAAELAAGETPSLDLQPFRLLRFAEGKTHEKELHF